MPPIDQILNIVVQQDATEIRLGSGLVPKLFRHGVAKRFLMPETSEDTLRDLLGELLDEHLPTVEEKGRARFDYGEFECVLRYRYSDGEEEEEGADEPPADREPVGLAIVFRRQATRASDEDEDDVAGLPAPAQPDPAGTAASATPGLPQSPVVVAPTAPAVRRTAAQPGPELVRILAYASDAGASDVHVGDGDPVYFRVDGRLRPQSGHGHQMMENLLDGCLTPWVRHQLDNGRSADFSLHLSDVGRFRVNIYASTSGLAAAFRVLPSNAPSLGKLNLPPSLADLVTVPHGLIIVCGATGSGKSATMAALLTEALRRRPGLLITLEDPIEYGLNAPSAASIVRQREVGRHIRDFATGLRDALREDPDVLMLGEMRDIETITLALTAAETGHLVLSSLHSRSATSAVERIVDAYPPERQSQIRVQLSDALRAVIAQRLVPRTTGKGRLPAVEVMTTTHSVASLIREGKTSNLTSAIQSSAADGMVPLERSLADLVESGRIDLAAARQACNNLETLNHYTRGHR